MQQNPLQTIWGTGGRSSGTTLKQLPTYNIQNYVSVVLAYLKPFLKNRRLTLLMSAVKEAALTAKQKEHHQSVVRLPGICTNHNMAMTL